MDGTPAVGTPADGAPAVDAFVVRIATPDDAAAIARHRTRMFREMGDVADADMPALADATTRYLDTAIASGEYHGWFALAHDEAEHPIAGAGVQLRPLLPRPGLAGPPAVDRIEALVVNVYVEPPWRRRGVAERLMRELMAWCDARGVARVVLHASVAGRPLYERLGFVQTNEMRYQPTSSPSSPLPATPPHPVP